MSKLLITTLTENLFYYHIYIYIYTYAQVTGKLVGSIMNSPVPKKLKSRSSVAEVERSTGLVNTFRMSCPQPDAESIRFSG